MNVVIIVDVFRAFTTAAYVLESQPSNYLLTTTSEVVDRLAKERLNPFLIGKAERGYERVSYTIPNSPTRFQNLKGPHGDVIHRTAAGAKGILDAQSADLILAAAFVNADATVHYVKSLKDAHITVLPMGHEATTPSLEDTLCAKYIEQHLKGESFDLAPYRTKLKESSGSYFFSEDQLQYPKEDFDRCLETSRFAFAIRATVKGDYAVLEKIDEQKSSLLKTTPS